MASERNFRVVRVTDITERNLEVVTYRNYLFGHLEEFSTWSLQGISTWCLIGISKRINTDITERNFEVVT